MDKRAALQLYSTARALRAEAAKLEAEAHQIIGRSDNPPLTVSELEPYGLNKETLRRAAESGLDVFVGPGEQMVAFRLDVEAWAQSRAKA